MEEVDMSIVFSRLKFTQINISNCWKEYHYGILSLSAAKKKGQFILFNFLILDFQKLFSN